MKKYFFLFAFLFFFLTSKSFAANCANAGGDCQNGPNGGYPNCCTGLTCIGQKTTAAGKGGTVVVSPGKCQTTATLPTPTPVPASTCVASNYDSGSCPAASLCIDAIKCTTCPAGYRFTSSGSNTVHCTSSKVTGFVGVCCDPDPNAYLTPMANVTPTLLNPCPGGACPTALGLIPTDPAKFVSFMFSVILSVSGGIGVLVIIFGGYSYAMSRGNPEEVKKAQEILTAGIVGLLFTIFSIAILKIIGVDILGISYFITK